MESAFAKHDRAREHFDNLKSEVDSFYGGEPYTFTSEGSEHLFDPNLRVITSRVHVKEKAPGLRWSLIVGDILSNLRASLDHAVYGHVATRGTLAPNLLRTISYPILLEPTAWPRAEKNLGGVVDADVLAVIKESQPFNQTKPEVGPLALLNMVVNQDKHRCVRVVSWAFGGVDTNTIAEVVRVNAEWRELNDDAVVSTVTVRLHPEEFDFTTDEFVALPINIRFDTAPYVELPTEIPDIGTRPNVLALMEGLVGYTGQLLNKLQEAGC